MSCLIQPAVDAVWGKTLPPAEPLYGPIENHPDKLYAPLFKNQQWRGTAHLVKSVDGRNTDVPVGINLFESRGTRNLYEGGQESYQNASEMMSFKTISLIVAKDASDATLKVFQVADILRKKADNQIYKPLGEVMDYTRFGFRQVNNTWYDPNDQQSAKFAQSRYDCFAGWNYLNSPLYTK